MKAILENFWRYQRLKDLFFGMRNTVGRASHVHSLGGQKNITVVEHAHVKVTVLIMAPVV